MLTSRVMKQLRAAIERAGGLHGRAGLARRWGVSKTYVSEAVARHDFPAPVTMIDGREVWAGIEADEWRGTTRKPGPVPRERGHDP